MHWFHVGVYVDNFMVFEFSFKLATHSKLNTYISSTAKKDAPNKVTILIMHKPW